MNEFESVAYLADSEILTLRVADSNEFSGLAIWNHHVVKGPTLFFSVFFLVVCDEGFAEVILVLLVVHRCHAFFVAVVH